MGTFTVFTEERQKDMMTFFKIVFSILLCCPLAYILVYLFNKIVEEATKKR